MTDQRYFNDYGDAAGSHYNFRNIFIRQKDLCEKYPALEPNGVNNLTLRLCLAQHAFAELFKQTLEVRQKTRPHDYTFSASMTGAATSGVASIHAIPIGSSAGEVVDIGLHNVHQHFYSFCTFATGVLDRLAVEIRMCYGLSKIPENQIDWGYFFRSDKETNWEELKNKNIFLVLNDSANNFEELRIKRNILEHRTFFEIKPGTGGHGFDYLIEGNTLLTDFIKNQLEKILALCNQVYEAIYKDASEVDFTIPIPTTK